MIKNLVKHGEGWALPIDQPVLDQLQLDPEAPLELMTDGQTLVVLPARDPARGRPSLKQRLRP
jgi:hypothetical protein